ncbi:MAG TPA: hypothetical protein VF753_16800 [Terriglobales bacterium]
MTLSSAFENVQQVTLHAIEGLLRKLEYLASLQDKKGGYEHWGITRVYGSSAAQEALSKAHRTVLSSVLATPISNLMDDIQKSSSSAGVSQDAYVQSLASDDPRMLPPNPGAGSELHLHSVIHALSSLLKARAHKADAADSNSTQI